MTPLDAALAYIARGWNPTPVKPRSKQPVHHGLADTDHRRRRSAAVFPQTPTSMSASCSGHRRTAWPTSISTARKPSPPRPTCCRRRPACSAARRTATAIGSTARDLASRSGDRQGRRQVRRPDDPTRKRRKLLELRIGGAAGAQTVFPPSTHETGEADRLVERQGSRSADDRPAPICSARSPPAGRRGIARPPLAAAADRLHNAARLLGGLLRRAGWPIADIAVFVEAVARAGMDPDPKDRVRTARDAAEAFDAGKKTQGLPTLEKTFGKEVADAVTDWLGLGRAQANDDNHSFHPDETSHPARSRPHRNRQ